MIYIFLNSFGISTSYHLKRSFFSFRFLFIFMLQIYFGVKLLNVYLVTYILILYLYIFCLEESTGVELCVGSETFPSRATVGDPRLQVRDIHRYKYRV